MKRDFNFRITGLDPAPFLALESIPPDELKSRGVVSYICDTTPGYPCRVTLEDAAPGETVYLLSHPIIDPPSPYQSRSPIFVRAGASAAFNAVNVIPPAIRHRRMVAARALNAESMILDAEVTTGESIEEVIDRMLADGHVRHIDLHTANRGCFLCRVHRA
jgi:Protein of unknown function (DUF1203)